MELIKMLQNTELAWSWHVLWRQTGYWRALWTDRNKGMARMNNRKLDDKNSNRILFFNFFFFLGKSPSIHLKTGSLFELSQFEKSESMLKLSNWYKEKHFHCVILSFFDRSSSYARTIYTETSFIYANKSVINLAST